MVSVRVRLRFDSTPVHYARQCWFLFNRDNCRVVEDVAFLVAKHFGLQDTDGIQLHMDGFLLPANESAEIIRDNDTIHVVALNKTDSESSPQGDDGTLEKKRKKVESCEDSKRKKRKLDNDSKEQSSGDGVSRKKRRKVDAGGTQEHVDHSPTQKQRNKKMTKHSVQSPTVSDKPTKRSPKKATSQDATANTHGPTPSKTKEGKLRSVTSKSASGALHTKFCSSSDEHEPEDSPQTVQTISGGRKKDNKRASLNSSFSGSKRKFPAVVGGPSDVHTTRSTIYTRTEETKNPREKPPNDVPTATLGVPTHVPTSTLGVPTHVPTDTPSVSTDVPSGTPYAPADITAGVPVDASMLDYASLPDLYGAPRVGDRIAFKVLELSTGYTPEISVYKEATVLTYDCASKSLRVKLSNATLQHDRQKVCEEALGRFSLSGQLNSNHDCTEEVEIVLGSLIHPKLIPLS